MEGATKIRESRTVTEEKAYWLLPGGVREVSPAPVSKIDFSSATARKRRMSQAIEGTLSVDAPTTPSRKVPVPTCSEQQNFYAALNIHNRQTAILSVTAPYQARFQPEVTKENYPCPLTTLADEECTTMDRTTLERHCALLDYTFTSQQAAAVEASTRQQANSKLWFRFRAGRITASKMKSVCRTSPQKPSMSLIKAICYPEQSKFTSSATAWGCAHEGEARTAYSHYSTAKHEHSVVSDCGLVLNPKFPEVGATPDAKVWCACCGTGVLEVKCPVCVQDPTHHHCLEANGDNVQLKRDHHYYFQVQTQLFVCEAKYADFAVWTEKGFHLERIYPDKQFWDSTYGQATQFFRSVILLELTGRYFTRNSNRALSPIKQATSTSVQDQASQNSKTVKWCLCHGEETDKMVACDNQNCNIEWFHFQCVRIKQAPRGKWLCPECRPQKKLKIKE